MNERNSAYNCPMIGRILKIIVIPATIKDLMKEKNMSIYRLSKETGISDSLLGKILNGKVENPRIQTVKQIAKALNVAIDEIVNMD